MSRLCKKKKALLRLARVNTIFKYSDDHKKKQPESVFETQQPLEAILRSSTSSGRLIKWAMMITQFAFEYHP